MSTFSGRDRSDSFSCLALDLLENLLKFDVSERFTVDQALRHPFLRHVYNEKEVNKVRCHHCHQSPLSPILSPLAPTVTSPVHTCPPIPHYLSTTVHRCPPLSTAVHYCRSPLVITTDGHRWWSPLGDRHCLLPLFVPLLPRSVTAVGYHYLLPLVHWSLVHGHCCTLTTAGHCWSPR